MEELTHSMRAALGVLMFIAAVTLFMGYIRAWEKTCDSLEKRLVRDTVITEIPE